jgi:hypothetical protein
MGGHSVDLQLHSLDTQRVESQNGKYFLYTVSTALDNFLMHIQIRSTQLSSFQICTVVHFYHFFNSIYLSLSCIEE